MEKGGPKSPAWGSSKTVAQRGKEQCSHLTLDSHTALGTQGSNAVREGCNGNWAMLKCTHGGTGNTEAAGREGQFR